MTDGDSFRTGGGLSELGAALDDDPLIGQVFGSYRINALLAEGGMGRVYRAVRADGQFDREVAIKVLPPGLGREYSQRFEQERQILATLSHPNIAQLFDAGLSDSGSLYLVMELIDGMPIDAFARERGLGIRAKAELMLALSEALAFAHSKLVVHRDLKPSNVFVTNDGDLRLLDFGIAKILEAPDSVTVESRPMTPKYASPEQLLNEPISVASDIYQLGLLFLSLFEQRDDVEEETRASATERAVKKASITVESRLAEKLPAELDAIINQCLRAEPAERYGSATALATDLRNYLGGYPVSARNPGAAQRVVKFVQRNLPATSFALLALIIAIGGTTSYTVNMAEARRVAERRAETASQTLRAMSSMIADTYSELIETRGSRAPGSANDAQLQNEPLRLVLERTERLIDAVVADQPELRAELLQVQGTTNRELNRMDQAQPQLEEALALMRGNNDAAGQVAVLRELMELFTMTEQNAIAAEYQDAALALIEQHEIPAEIRARALVSATIIQVDAGNFDRALQFGQQAVDILETAGPEPTIDLALAYAQLGGVYSRLENPRLSREWTRKAVDLYIELEGSSYRGLSTAYNGLAYSHVMEGDYATAVEYLERDIAVARANFGENHIRFVLPTVNLGVTLRRMGRYEEALDHFRRAQDILGRLPGDHSARDVTLAINLGNTYQDLGNLRAAARIFEEALPLSEDENAPPRGRASLLNNSGDLMMIRGDLDGAIERLGLARQVKTEIYGEDNISTARTLLLLAQAHMAAGDLAPVPELLETAGNSYVANYGADSRKMSFFELVTGQYRLAAGDIEGAREILHAAYEHRLEEYDPANILVLSPLFTLVSVELSAGDRAQAREWFEKTRPAVERLRETHAELIEAGVLEAELLAAEGRDAEALSTAAATLGLISEHFPARRDWIDRLTAISTRSGA
jgi:serine/threonine-protein kinase